MHVGCLLMHECRPTQLRLLDEHLVAWKRQIIVYRRQTQCLRLPVFLLEIVGVEQFAGLRVVYRSNLS